MPSVTMASPQLIPAKHRDKLKVLVVLKGYSSIACGEGMKVGDQQKKLHEFVYGSPPDKISHIDLLCKGLSEYNELYEESTYQSIDEDGKTLEIDGMKLRPELIKDYSQPYYAGIHITLQDMQSTNRSGKITFATPKTLLTWARSAAAEFRRADAYSSKWWDSDSLSPKMSGDSEDDVRRHVIQAMWDYQQKKNRMRKVMRRWMRRTAR